MRISSERTHGRWPWVSAAAAAPATALVYRKREELCGGSAWVEWLPLVALLWHQTEEWVWPGGFLPWFNRQALGSGEDEFPIDRRAGLLINVGMGWGVGLAAGITRSPAVSAFQLALIAGNAAMHIGQAARSSSRNPGLLTSVGCFAPLSAAGFASLGRRSPPRAVGSGAAAGVVASAGLMVTMKLRLRRRLA